MHEQPSLHNGSPLTMMAESSATMENKKKFREGQYDLLSYISGLVGGLQLKRLMTDHDD
jgi:hypothetical protein